VFEFELWRAGSAFVKKMSRQDLMIDRGRKAP